MKINRQIEEAQLNNYLSRLDTLQSRLCDGGSIEDMERLESEFVSLEIEFKHFINNSNKNAN